MPRSASIRIFWWGLLIPTHWLPAKGYWVRPTTNYNVISYHSQQLMPGKLFRYSCIVMEYSATKSFTFREALPETAPSDVSVYKATDRNTTTAYFPDNVPIYGAVALTITAMPGTCQTASNQYSISGTLSLTNAVAGTATVTDGLSTTTVTISAGATSVPYALSGLTSGTGSHTVTVSYASQTANQTYMAPASCSSSSLSQCTPFDACSGPDCPGNYPGTIIAGDPPNSGYNGIDNNFNVIVKGNFTVPVNGGAETEGRIAVGGNFIMDRDYYGVGTSGGGTFVIAPDRGYNLVVRGAIQRTVGTTGVLGNAQSGFTPITGRVLVGSSVPATITVSSGGINDIKANQGTSAIDAQVNINAVLANLAIKSTCYTSLPPTGSFNSATQTLQGDNSSALQVFNLSSADVSELESHNLLFSNIPAGATIIINVAGSVINWQVANVAASVPNDPNYSFLGTTDPDVDVRRVLFNFSGASSVTFNSTVNGSVLVPNGDVVLNGNLNGRLAVGGNLTQSGDGLEIHNYPFDGSCTCASCSLAVTVNPGSCNPATNTYSVTGTVNLSNNPAQKLTIKDGTATTTVSVSAGQASATYSLTGLPSGTGSHTITVTSSATSCNPGSQPYTAPVSCTLTPTSIGDLVWIDANRNGQQDSGEAGIDGVTVRLLQQSNPPGTYMVVSTTATANGGHYLFTNLSAGTYLMEFVASSLPANYVFTTSNAPGVPIDMNSDANPVTGRTAPVMLVPGNPAQRTILTLDAGVYDAGCPPGNCQPIVIIRTR